MVTTRRQLRRSAFEQGNMNEVLENNSLFTNWTNIITVLSTFYFLAFFMNYITLVPHQNVPLPTNVPFNLTNINLRDYYPPRRMNFSMTTTNTTATNYTQISSVIITTSNPLFKSSLEENRAEILAKLNVQRPDYYNWTAEIAEITSPSVAFHVSEYVNIGGRTMVPIYNRVIKTGDLIDQRMNIDVYRNTSWVKETSLYVF